MEDGNNNYVVLHHGLYNRCAETYMDIHTFELFSALLEALFKLQSLDRHLRFVSGVFLREDASYKI